MTKWKCEICNSEFENFQAQGFNGIIYCPLCYFKELYKREKEKIDKAMEYIKEEELDVNADEGMTDYSDCFSYIIKMLKGENND